MLTKKFVSKNYNATSGGATSKDKSSSGTPLSCLSIHLYIVTPDYLIAYAQYKVHQKLVESRFLKAVHRRSAKP